MLLRPVHGKRNGGDRGVVTDNWEKIRQDYLTGNESQAALARRYGISRTALSKRIRQEGWKREATPGWESRLRRVDALADRMLTALERAVEELDTVTQSVREKTKTDDGREIVTEFQRLLPGEQGIIDRGGLKQLTGVLKDIKDVLMLRSEADSREQEARIAKLQRDLQKEEMQSRVIVTMEGGCDEFGD